MTSWVSFYETETHRKWRACNVTTVDMFVPFGFPWITLTQWDASKMVLISAPASRVPYLYEVCTACVELVHIVGSQLINNYLNCGKLLPNSFKYFGGGEEFLCAHPVDICLAKGKKIRFERSRLVFIPSWVLVHVYLSAYHTSKHSFLWRTSKFRKTKLGERVSVHLWVEFIFWMSRFAPSALVNESVLCHTSIQYVLVCCSRLHMVHLFYLSFGSNSWRNAIRAERSRS